MKLHRLLLPLALTVCLAAAAQAPTPHITPNTLRVEIPERSDIVTVSDGVVTLQEKSGFHYAFFSIPYGRMLGGFDYKYGGGGKKPAFSGGAIMVVREIPNPANTWNPFKELHMLTDDGIDVKLPDEVKDARNFKDGVASLRWQHKGERVATFNYVDANLNPVLTEFVDNWKGSGVLDARPLREGMRAVWSMEAKAFGYADADGKTVIAPKYKKALEFGDGVAFVSTDGKLWGLIDKTGKAVHEETLDLGWTEPEPFHCGRAWCPAKNAYIDKKGQFSTQFSAGGSFFDGFAIIRNSDYRFASINTQYIQGKEFNDLYDLPVFSGGLAVAKFDGGKTSLINTGGEVKMQPGEFQSLLGTDGEFVWLSMDPEENGGYNHAAYAVADLNGEILYVFDCAESGMFKGKGLREAPEPIKIRPWEPGGGETEPPVPPLPPGQDRDKGKGKWPKHKTGSDFGKVLLPEKVIVTLTAEPAEGGQIAGGGTYDIGAVVPVGALPGEGWAFSGFSCSDKAYEKALNAGWTFTPSHGGKVTVTAHFYKQGEIAEKRLGSAYVGRAKARLNEGDAESTWPMGMEFDVVLDSDDKGILTFKFDPKRRFGGYLITNSGSKDRSKDVTLDEMYSVFWSPYEIKGFGTEGGTKYIYLHGGLMMVGNIPSQELRFLFMLLAGENRTDDEGSYVLRNKINDYRIAYDDLPDGSIRLGRMQICYPGVGWIYTDEEDKMKWKFTSYLIAMSMQRDERYMPSHLVEGTVLRKQSGPFEIPLYPDRSWFSDDAHYNACKKLLDGYYNGTITAEEPKGWTSKDEAYARMKAHVNTHSLKWFFAPEFTPVR